MSSVRLNESLLRDRQESLYRSRGGKVGIVHLGLGAFHRAHQAWYTDQAMRASGDQSWFIAGVSLRSAGVKERLVPQDCLYNVVEAGQNGLTRHLVESISNVLVAPEDPSAVLTLMADSDTRIISLTITEKGYCHDPATGELNLAHPDIQHDLNNMDRPVSAIGFLVASLDRRFRSGSAAPTVLCCDNLPSNGKTLAGLVAQFASVLSLELASWIAANVTFPCTMVDRIVPATTDADIAGLAETLGYEDRGLVKTEPFSQWVIEDNFVAGRPRWEVGGAILVGDVEAFENAKLRLLNGAHSALAYLGYLCGYEYVHEVIEDRFFAGYLRTMMHDEIAPTLVAPAGLDLDEYIGQLLERFANPSLCHRTYQIAMDGSQKVPQRLLHTTEARLAQGHAIDCLSFAVAGWLRYSTGFDLKGDPIEVQDPYVVELRSIREQHWGHIDELVDAYLRFNKVFSSRLCADEHFRERLTYWLSHILANGVNTALKILLIEIGSGNTGEYKTC